MKTISTSFCGNCSIKQSSFLMQVSVFIRSSLERHHCVYNDHCLPLAEVTLPSTAVETAIV